MPQQRTTIEVDARTAKFLSDMSAVIALFDKTGDAAANAAAKSKKTGDKAATGFARATQEATKLASQVAGVGTALGAITSVITLMRQEVDRIRQAAEASTQIRRERGAAITAAQRAFPPGTSREFIRAQAKRGAQLGNLSEVLMLDAARVVASATAAGEALPEGISPFDIGVATAQEFQDLVTERPVEFVQTAGALGELLKSAKIIGQELTPQQGAAYIKAITRQARSVDIAEISRQVIPGISQLAIQESLQGRPVDLEALGAMFVSQQNIAGDVSGRRTINALTTMQQNLNQLIGERVGGREIPMEFRKLPFAQMRARLAGAGPGTQERAMRDLLVGFAQLPEQELREAMELSARGVTPQMFRGVAGGEVRSRAAVASLFLPGAPGERRFLEAQQALQGATGARGLEDLRRDRDDFNKARNAQELRHEQALVRMRETGADVDLGRAARQRVIELQQEFDKNLKGFNVARGGARGLQRFGAQFFDPKEVTEDFILRAKQDLQRVEVELRSAGREVVGPFGRRHRFPDISAARREELELEQERLQILIEAFQKENQHLGEKVEEMGDKIVEAITGTLGAGVQVTVAGGKLDETERIVGGDLAGLIIEAFWAGAGQVGE